MKIVGIIPARYASTRFPGKPLALLEGKPIIQHVYERCLACKDLSDLYVATDDERIAQVVKDLGGKVFISDTSHLSGTDRCAELARQLDADAIINIQGDEVKISASQISQVAQLLKNGAPIASLARKTDLASAQDKNVVKVVINQHQEALYFSRSVIPHGEVAHYLHHIGIYGYQKDVLLDLTNLPASDLEVSESLEQLRWLDHGYKIILDISELENISIDTLEDLQSI